MNTSPLSAQQYNEQGKAFARKGDYVAALECFFHAIDTDPNLAPSYNNIAVMCWQIGDRDNALKHLSKALQLAPADSNIVMSGAELLVLLDLKQEARQILQDYLQARPRDMRAREKLAALE